MTKYKVQSERLKVKWILLSIFIFQFSFYGCRPRGILHSWEMRDVMVDLHKTDAMMQAKNIPYNSLEARGVYYAQVMERHGITQAQFDSSLVWYTAHPQLFDKIYPKVLKELHAQEDAFLAAHEEELNLKPVQPQEIRFYTAAQIDSLVHVALHGYPVCWGERPRPEVEIPYQK